MARVIIDSDGHVNERDEVILEYLPEPFRGRRALLGRTLFPLTDNFHRMAEGMLDGRRGAIDVEYGAGRAGGSRSTTGTRRSGARPSVKATTTGSTTSSPTTTPGSRASPWCTSMIPP